MTHTKFAVLSEVGVLPVLQRIYSHHQKSPRIAANVEPRANPRALQEWGRGGLRVVSAHISVYSKLSPFDDVVLVLALILHPTHRECLNSNGRNSLSA